MAPLSCFCDFTRSVTIGASDPLFRVFSTAETGAEYCDERVCLSVCVRVCVCLSAIISPELHVRSSPIFAHVTCGRGSVLFWRRREKSYVLPVLWMTSQAKVARRRRPAEAQCTRSLGLGCKLCAVILVASQRTHGTTFRSLRVTVQVATPGAESAVYDCLVNFCD